MNTLRNTDGNDIFEELGLRTFKNGVAHCPNCNIVIRYPNITDEELDRFCDRCHGGE